MSKLFDALCDLTNAHAEQVRAEPILDGFDIALNDAYAEGRKDEAEVWRPMRDNFIRLLQELHRDEVLSEQQCAKYFGVDLLTWRFVEPTCSLCDGGGEIDSGGVHPCGGGINVDCPECRPSKTQQPT